jgi:plasmid stabilization system protein ParE
MRLAVSPRAARDLEDIDDYIARDNPARAVSFISELRLACVAIAANPQGFPVQFCSCPKADFRTGVGWGAFRTPPYGVIKATEKLPCYGECA